MCGLAGYIGISPPDEYRISLTLSELTHRGPDGFGSHRDQLADGRSVVLLHTRLSILDISDRAAQPLCYRDTVLSFNGEIFNFRELRKKLIARGAQFRLSLIHI